MTKQRELIRRIVLTSSSHMTAEEIWLAAKQEMPSIVMATVYNNLNALSRTGEIAHIQVPNAPDHYDKTIPPHFHLVCDVCGNMEDIMGVTDPTVELERLSGEKIHSLDLNAHYVCRACKEAQA